ncbi:MAG: hypothetical protein M1449_07705 [Candidatus Thermoplasmatota archaeon]|nr:hypothetical protein [Candidatus Thermoplasmatota archaeon]
MRVSTQILFESGAARIGELQSGLLKTQQQVSTGRRILTPADDPVAAARALEVTQSQSLNTRYGVNRQHAKSALGALEGTLASVTALMQDVKTTVIAAGNGALSDTERGFMATELRGSAAGKLLSEATFSLQNESGVNLDEEAANLLRYQQAYQAAGKVMQIASEMFDTLLSLGR